MDIPVVFIVTLFCLEVFTVPVTTPCGHNYCKSCITQSCDKSQFYYCCPFCEEKFTTRPELKATITLREDADHFKKETVSDKSQDLCDVCIDVIQEAIKSCLDCGVSFCSSHKKHKLISAVKNLEKYICQKHKKYFELFCRDDQKCVCEFCTEGEHKNHNVIPLEEETGQRKSQLEETQRKLQQMIQERVKKIQEINDSVELNKRNTEKEKSDSVEVFTVLIRSIERSQAELLKVMEEKQKAVEKQAEELIKELEQEINELKRRNTELEKLSHTDDHLQLLQMFPSLYITPHTKNWTTISINTDLNVNTLRTTLSQLQQTLNEKLREADLKRIQQYAVDVTLDPDSAHPNLLLSDDGKQVTHGDREQKLPDTPKRFTYFIIVLGNQGFSSGRFYFEVQVSGKTGWNLGVIRESVNRKGEIEKFNPEGGFWTVILWNGEYFACDDASLSVKVKPEKVGVFVDYEEGLVSFYDVEAKSHLYSFTGHTFTEKLYPFFDPGLNDGGKNSAPLIISHMSKSK